ncbi:MAG: hypothetical protein IJM17_07465 [Firmicutes bacterium]|nr:hypothetical protein [Bacillota bacterium]
MKKYIRLYWAVMAAAAAVSPLFRMIPGRNWGFYIVASAIAAGYVNYKATHHIVETGERIRYLEIEELKTIVYTRSGRLDPATTPKILVEEYNDLKFIQIQNYIYIVMVLLLAAFYIKH